MTASTDINPSNRREVRGWCALCRSRCGSISVVEGGRLVEVKPDHDHPTGGALCPKGRAGPEIVHSTRRILTPLRRTRPKTDPDPGWEPIGWDEALDEVARAMEAARDEIGPEAVAFAVTTPSGTGMSDGIDWVDRFIRLFGSPNNVYGTEVCNWHKDHAHAFTFGCGIPVAQYADAKLNILWGHNPSNAWLAQAGKVAEGRGAGAKMIVIDPRRSAHAAEADLWLQVRPGTDAALALGLSHLLIANGRYDHAFVGRWTNAALLVREDDGSFLRACDLEGSDTGAEGFVAWEPERGEAVPVDTRFATERPERFAFEGRFEVATRSGPVACRPVFAHFREACRAYDPQTVARITGVPAADVARAADLLAEAGRDIAYHGWTGVGQHANASQTDRAMATLYGLTGAFDTLRGNLRMSKLPAKALSSIDQLDPKQRRKALGLDRLPLGPPSTAWIIGSDLYGAVLDEKPYPVRVLVAFGSNLLLSQPDTGRARAALERLPFHVHCDIFHSPTSAYADIVLPVSTPWEREALRFGFELTQQSEEIVALRPAALPPAGEARSDIDIVLGLAQRLGLGPDFFDGDIETGWNHMLSPLGITVDDLRRQGGTIRHPLQAVPEKHGLPAAPDEPDGAVRGFETETRRVELYSALLLRHGYSPVPVHRDPATGASASARYPLTLVSAKIGHFCHSQHRGVASLRRRSPDPVAELHPGLAAARGIVEDDWLRISTATGEARFRARIEPSLQPDTIVAQNGWWQDCPDLGLPGYAPLEGSGSNFNALIGADATACDPISGAPAMRSTACDISRDPNVASGWDGFRGLRVAAVEPEADGAISLTLTGEAGERMPGFRPGQHLPLRIRPTAPGELPMLRSYSLVSTAADKGTGHYRITVKRIEADALRSVAAGRASTALTRHIAVGDTIEARMPGGRFILPVEADFPVVLIAAGIGITPFRSYLETLLRSDRRPEILLVHGSRDGLRHIFRSELASVAGAMPNLSIVNAYSRPAASDRIGIDFDVEGRLSADLVPEDLIARRARFYMCGPEAMMNEVTAQLRGRGVFPFEIFREAFTAAGMPTSQPADVAHKVRFARSNCDAIWTPSDGSLLDLAERLGLKLPAGCRVGQCESCVVRLVSGNVASAAEAEIDAGSCLTCRSVPTSAVVLDA